VGGRRSRLPLLVVAAWMAIAGAKAPVHAAGDRTLAPGHPDVRLRVVTAAEEVVVDVPLGEDGTWELVWTHSVAQVQVRDSFAWRRSMMWLTDHRTPYLDIAGLGHTPGSGELRDDGEGGYWIADIDLRLAGDVHRFIIGSAFAPTTLLHAGRVHDLSASHPGVRARIEVIEP
jgi:hypothetical protein